MNNTMDLNISRDKEITYTRTESESNTEKKIYTSFHCVNAISNANIAIERWKVVTGTKKKKITIKN